MDKVQHYQQRAAECRALSVGAVHPDLRKHFSDLADVWEQLADERLRYFVPDGRKDHSSGSPSS